MRALASSMVASIRPRSHQRAVQEEGRGLGLTVVLFLTLRFN